MLFCAGDKLYCGTEFRRPGRPHSANKTVVRNKIPSAWKAAKISKWSHSRPSLCGSLVPMQTNSRSAFQADGTLFRKVISSVLNCGTKWRQKFPEQSCRGNNVSYEVRSSMWPLPISWHCGTGDPAASCWVVEKNRNEVPKSSINPEKTPCSGLFIAASGSFLAGGTKFRWA